MKKLGCGLKKTFCIMMANAMMFGLLHTFILNPEQKAHAAGPYIASENIGLPLFDWVLDEANGFIYAISQQPNKLLFISADTLEVTKSISLESFPTDIELYNNKLYIPIQKSKLIIEVDTATQDVAATITVKNEPVRVARYKDTLFYNGEPTIPYYEQWNNVYAYSQTTKAESQVNTGGIWCPRLVVDQTRGILYFSSMNQVYSYSAEDLTPIGMTNSDLGHEYVGYSSMTLLLNSNTIYFKGKAFDPDNLSSIYGSYTQNNNYDIFNGVYHVRGKHVFTKNAVFDRDTFTKIANLPFDTTLILTDSGENVYLFDQSANALVKTRLEADPDTISRNITSKNSLELENKLREWVYDGSTNYIYAITDNSNAILYINPVTMKVDGEKWIGSGPIDIELANNKIYVALSGATRIAFTGTGMSDPVESIALKTIPHSIAVDGDKVYYAEEKWTADLYVYNVKDGLNKKLTAQLPNWVSFHDPDLVLDRANHILYVGEFGSTGDKLTAYSTANDSVFFTTAVYGDARGKLTIAGTDVYYDGHRFNNASKGMSLGNYGSNVYGAYDRYVFTDDGIYDRDSYSRIVAVPFGTAAYRVLVGRDGAAFFCSEVQSAIIRFNSVQPYPASIDVYGSYEIVIPSSGTASSTYEAIIGNQYGTRLYNQSASWSLLEPAAGVSIDQMGKVTVKSTAREGAICVAGSVNGLSAVYTVELKKYTVNERLTQLSELVSTGDYYLNSWMPFQNHQYLLSAVKSGKAVLQKSTASMAEISAAIYQLEAQLNRVHLEVKLIEANSLQQSDFTSQRWDELQEILSFARGFVAGNPYPADVDAVLDMLYFTLEVLPAFDAQVEMILRTYTAQNTTPKTWTVIAAALTEALALRDDPYGKYDEISSMTAKLQYGVHLDNLERYLAGARELMQQGTASFKAETWNSLTRTAAAAEAVLAKAEPTADEVLSANAALKSAIYAAEMELRIMPAAHIQMINCSAADWDNFQTALQSAENLLRDSGATIDQLYEALLNLTVTLEAIFTSAPEGFTGVAASSASDSDGALFGTTPLMEYKLTSAETWIPADGSVITGLTAGTYTVRYSAKTGFGAGLEASVAIPATSTVPPQDSTPFDDVRNDIWYSDAVKFAAARGITKGTANNLFSPDLAISRGQFIVMLLRAYGIAPDTKSADNFADAGNTYYTNYLSVAKRLGISKGVGGNAFKPDDTITRQDMMTMLFRALTLLGKLPEQSGGNTLDSYSDASVIAAYAHESMDTFVKSGIVSGSSGMLSPYGITSRAQVTQVFYRLLSQQPS